jgi:hypothetical protein
MSTTKMVLRGHYGASIVEITEFEHFSRHGDIWGEYEKSGGEE